MSEPREEEKMSQAERNYDRHNSIFLGKNTNQALGIAQYALKFMAGQLGTGPSPAVTERVQLFHTDATLCGLSALALRTNAPTVLRDEALRYPADTKNDRGATVFGSSARVVAEKAICASASAVREWDSNGTVFGYNEKLGNTAGEFGHNDFYGVAVSACQQRGLDGKTALLGMICIDEIRGRLSEVFALNRYKIDHVVHGAIASAAVYGAIMGATAQQIEYAIGMFVAHYVPWRAIRAGHQLSDSKGASAALSTEMAVLCMMRAMRGFVGPADIFRNPLSLFRRFEPTDGSSPFDLVLTHSGDDFAVMGMHFKLGLYEHQSAGAIQGFITMLQNNRQLALSGPEGIASIKIIAYEPAFSIIGDPAKKNPTSRQSADHSMVYIVSTLLRKAFEAGANLATTNDAIWQQLMLMPVDYSNQAMTNTVTRGLMDKITFAHGGDEYDAKYPDGIPTSVVITTTSGQVLDSGLVMYPGGHARNTANDLNAIMQTKFARMASFSVTDPDGLLAKLNNVASLSPEQLDTLYSDLTITYAQENLFEPLEQKSHL
jgi:2-methylcitrate dehydratase